MAGLTRIDLLLVVRGPGEGRKIRASVHCSSGETGILVVAVVLYLGFRAWQGIDWLVHHL